MKGTQLVQGLNTNIFYFSFFLHSIFTRVFSPSFYFSSPSHIHFQFFYFYITFPFFLTTSVGVNYFTHFRFLYISEWIKFIPLKLFSTQISFNFSSEKGTLYHWIFYMHPTFFIALRVYISFLQFRKMSMPTSLKILTKTLFNYQCLIP